MGLVVSNNAPRLSEYIIGEGGEKESSLRSKTIQESSDVAEAMLRNSALVVLQDTTTCFLEDNVMRFDPRYMQNLEVDFLSMGSEPQSASAKQQRVRSVFGVKRIPK